jgi:hypothetical protein
MMLLLLLLLLLAAATRKERGKNEVNSNCLVLLRGIVVVPMRARLMRNRGCKLRGVGKIALVIDVNKRSIDKRQAL